MLIADDDQIGGTSVELKLLYNMLKDAKVARCCSCVFSCCCVQAVQPGYPYPVSTILIPENVFVAAASVPTRTKKAVATALYRYQNPHWLGCS